MIKRLSVYLIFFRAGRMVQLQQKNLPFCSYIVSNPSHNYKQAQTDSDRLDIDWAELCIQESIIWTRNCSNNGLHWLVSTFLCVVLLNLLCCWLQNCILSQIASLSFQISVDLVWTFLISTYLSRNMQPFLFFASNNL